MGEASTMLVSAVEAVRAVAKEDTVEDALSTFCGAAASGAQARTGPFSASSLGEGVATQSAGGIGKSQRQSRQSSESSTSMQQPVSSWILQPWPSAARPWMMALCTPAERGQYMTVCPALKVMAGVPWNAAVLPPKLFRAGTAADLASRNPPRTGLASTRRSGETFRRPRNPSGGCGGCEAVCLVDFRSRHRLPLLPGLGPSLRRSRLATLAIAGRRETTKSRSWAQSRPSTGEAFCTVSDSALPKTPRWKCSGRSDRPRRSTTKRPVTISVISRPSAQQSSPTC
mmetsp:Transcript_62638/g.149444  ORF Transcript_62638/g.149444 Transcript_62638/m.149444 type:complete len:285 (+) Transcript_62638:298-1152(+)